MDLREIGWEGVGCMHLVQGETKWQTVMNAEMNLWVS
jgi:hypothetical protein